VVSEHKNNAAVYCSLLLDSCQLRKDWVDWEWKWCYVFNVFFRHAYCGMILRGTTLTTRTMLRRRKMAGRSSTRMFSVFHHWRHSSVLYLVCESWLLRFVLFVFLYGADRWIPRKIKWTQNTYSRNGMVAEIGHHKQKTQEEKSQKTQEEKWRHQTAIKAWKFWSKRYRNVRTCGKVYET